MDATQTNDLEIKENARYGVGRCYVPEILKSLADEWTQEANGEEFGIITNTDEFFNHIGQLVNRDDAIVLLLLKDAEVIGFMSVLIFRNPLGQERIANEHFWFVRKEDRGPSTIRLLKSAEQWAKDNGCSHLMMNASKFAGDSHDKVCRLYERLGMKLFETTYIKELKE